MANEGGGASTITAPLSNVPMAGDGTGCPAPAGDAPPAPITVIGDRANLLIVREAFRRTRRYQEFKERLGVSDAVLAGRLRDLVKSGILHTVVYSTRPLRHEYRLTDCGTDFWQTAVGMWSWEQQWGVPTSGRHPVMTHLDCAKQTTAAFGCGRCGKPGLEHADVSIDRVGAMEQVGHTPALRYRRASWKPASSIDLYSEIDALVGDRWTVTTLSAALMGLDRFGDLQRALQISPPLLSQRLAHMVDRQVLTRVVVPGAGAHHRYHLTDKGRALLPVLACNTAWASKWFPSLASLNVPVVHASCQDELVPAWFCTDCSKPMELSSMTFDIYPDATSPLASHMTRM